ncbi:MAG TPA: M1 family aminopeptidase, partial [Planctomycetota bacterium]|nr:M1 family aminopeptidase [Planctomycetota bacterium]
YSEWFGTYPWQELKLSEFPDLARYAQGFPTNITFSEGIGFLNADDPRSAAAFAVTAHESAHQWWGNIVVPAKAPGGAVLSEGMAHFSTLLLLDAVKGPRARLEFAKRLESSYGNSRHKDAERSLARVDGSRAGDTSVIYDRGGLVLWMLSRQLGREAMFSGLRAFVAQWSAGPDHPAVEDLLDSLRPLAPDGPAFESFCRSWILGTDVPEYLVTSAERVPLEPGDPAFSPTEPKWRVTCMLSNTGSGAPELEVAAVRGTRFPDEDGTSGEAPEPGDAQDGRPPGDADDAWRESRATVRLQPGDPATITLLCDFEPTEVLVDPDVQVLMLKREAARFRF